MARTPARLPNGTRLSDYVILGVLTTTVPAAAIDAVLADTGRQSRRQRQLPARLVGYYVMALALYAQASYGEVQLRLLTLTETGTHAIFAASFGPYDGSEVRLAPELLPQLQPGMLCLADRAFVGFELWRMATAPGADLLWRVRKNQQLPCRQRLPDGSYLSSLYASPKHRRHDEGGLMVRVVDYRLEGVPGAEPLYRLVTTLLDPAAAPAAELAALYHERWESEGAFAELKVSLPGERLMLRSRRADLVEQEVYGLLLVHLALRQLIYEASRQTGCDPDQLSFLHAVRVVRRHLPLHAAFSPSPAPQHAGCG